MKAERAAVDGRGALLALAAVLLVSVYQAMFFYAPEALARPLWSESALTLSTLFGLLSLLVPVAFSWWMIRTDRSDGEIHDTSGH